MSNKSKVGIALVALYLIWGSTYLAIQISLESLPPLLTAGARFVVAGVVLMAYLLLRANPLPLPTRRQWLSALIVGGLMLGGGVGGTTYAIQFVASGLAAIMIGAVPLWTMLIGIAYGNRPDRIELIALLIGFTGIIVLNLEGNLRANPGGALLLLAAGFSWALGSMLSTRLEMARGLMGYAAQMLIGPLPLIVLALALGERIMPGVTLHAFGAWLYLLVGSSLIGYSAYLYLLKTVPVSLATSYAYVNPVVALLLGLYAAQEPITRYGVVAMVLVSLSVALLTLGPRLRRSRLRPVQATQASD